MNDEPIDEDLKEKEEVKITIRAVRTDVSGKEFGPWKVINYVHHYGNTPIWAVECMYCGTKWNSSLPRIKKKKECECEDSMKYTCPAYIVNNIYLWYLDKAKSEDALFGLSYNDLYKLYLRQGGVDAQGNKLVFDYHYNYSVDPPTCNYIWPDLERKNRASSYSLSNCFFTANPNQRFPKRHSKNTKKLMEALKQRS